MRIVSGGQTGVDQAALVAARLCGLETGGWAARGWLTERGPEPSLADFGLVEWPIAGYPPRTAANVADSDATCWLGPKGSSGWRCTRRAAAIRGKEFVEFNLGRGCHRMLAWLLSKDWSVINIAGSRESAQTGIQVSAREMLVWVFQQYLAKKDSR